MHVAHHHRSHVLQHAETHRTDIHRLSQIQDDPATRRVHATTLGRNLIHARQQQIHRLLRVVAHIAALRTEPAHRHTVLEATGFRQRLGRCKDQRNRIEGHHRVVAIGVEAVHAHQTHRNHSEISTIQQCVTGIAHTHAHLRRQGIICESQRHRIRRDDALSTHTHELLVAVDSRAIHIHNGHTLQSASRVGQLGVSVSHHLRRRTRLDRHHVQRHIAEVDELLRTSEVVAQRQTVLIAADRHRVSCTVHGASEEHHAIAARASNPLELIIAAQRIHVGVQRVHDRHIRHGHSDHSRLDALQVHSHIRKSVPLHLVEAVHHLQRTIDSLGHAQRQDSVLNGEVQRTIVARTQADVQQLDEQRRLRIVVATHSNIASQTSARNSEHSLRQCDRRRTYRHRMSQVHWLGQRTELVEGIEALANAGSARRRNRHAHRVLVHEIHCECCTIAPAWRQALIHTAQDKLVLGRETITSHDHRCRRARPDRVAFNHVDIQGGSGGEHHLVAATAIQTQVEIEVTSELRLNHRLVTLNRIRLHVSLVVQNEHLHLACDHRASHRNTELRVHQHLQIVHNRIHRHSTHIHRTNDCTIEPVAHARHAGLQSHRAAQRKLLRSRAVDTHRHHVIAASSHDRELEHHRHIRKHHRRLHRSQLHGHHFATNSSVDERALSSERVAHEQLRGAGAHSRKHSRSVSHISNCHSLRAILALAQHRAVGTLRSGDQIAVEHHAVHLVVVEYAR